MIVTVSAAVNSTDSALGGAPSEASLAAKAASALRSGVAVSVTRPSATSPMPSASDVAGVYATVGVESVMPSVACVRRTRVPESAAMPSAPMASTAETALSSACVGAPPGGPSSVTVQCLARCAALPLTVTSSPNSMTVVVADSVAIPLTVGAVLSTVGRATSPAL